MKRISIATFLLFSLLLLLPGCESSLPGTIPPSATPGTAIPAETVPPTVFSTPQPFDKDNVGGNWVPGNSSVFNISQDLPQYTLSNQYNGKTRSEYETAAIGAPLVWGEQMFSSPDGKYVLFSSNRNCLDSDGMSIFLLDCQNGEEHLLVDGTDGYYSVIGWWPNEHATIIQKDKNDIRTYILCSVDGAQDSIDIKGDFPTIIAFRDNKFIFTEDFNSNSVGCGTLSTDGTIYDIVFFTPVAGYLTGEYVIAPNLKRVALKVRNSYESTNRSVLIWDITSGTSTTLPLPDIDGAEDIAAIDLSWEDTNLIVDFSITIDGTDSNRTFTWLQD